MLGDMSKIEKNLARRCARTVDCFRLSERYAACGPQVKQLQTKTMFPNRFKDPKHQNHLYSALAASSCFLFCLSCSSLSFAASKISMGTHLSMYPRTSTCKDSRTVCSMTGNGEIGKIMHLRFANTVDRFQLSKCHTKLAVRKSNNLQSNKCGPTENVEHPRRFKHPRH